MLLAQSPSHPRTMAPAAAPRISGTIRSKNPLKGAVEILPERLYYAALKTPPPSHNILASTPRRDNKKKAGSPTEHGDKKQIHFFNIDEELVYWNFFLDFGPLNLGQLTRFSYKLNDKLRKFPVVCFYSNTVPSKRANAIFLICAWQLLYLDRTPEQAYAGFDHSSNSSSSVKAPSNKASKQQQQQPATSSSSMSSSAFSLPPVSHSQGAPTVQTLPPFHDASPCACTYDLTVVDCLKGLAKARSCGFLDLDTFDVEEYEYFEQVENGDLNWIVKGKILAFAGPSFERHVSPEGYCTLAPSDYIPYFQRKQVSLVVRLNKKCYEEQDFVDAGIDHLEAFFLDGSCPPMKILQQVLQAFEAVPKGQAFAVHCKAGLGRTGTCIGAYLMKHYRFTAAEVIAWMRICRPGMVIGPQQHFLQQIEQRMWQEGAAYEGVSVVDPPFKSMVALGQGSNYNSNNTNNEPLSPRTQDVEDGKVAADAVVGRAGQADGLLAARGRRNPNSSLSGGGRNNSSTSRDMKSVLPTTVPITPEQRSTKGDATNIVTPEKTAAKLRF